MRTRVVAVEEHMATEAFLSVAHGLDSCRATRPR